MNKLKQSRHQKPYKPEDWLEYIDSYSPRFAIPIGPAFQAEVPTLISSPYEEYSYNSDTLRWLGTQSWPIPGKIMNIGEGAIGKGRLESCRCSSPVSVECIKRHIGEKRIQLQTYLGPAFWIWKFDEMGEEVSKSWTSEEQKEFESMVKFNPLLRGKKFSSQDSFSSKCKEEYIRYYFNVFVPRRIRIRARSHCKIIDSDGDDGDDAGDKETLSYKNQRKRGQGRVDDIKFDCRKHMKARYTMTHCKIIHSDGDKDDVGEEDSLRYKIERKRVQIDDIKFNCSKHMKARHTIGRR